MGSAIQHFLILLLLCLAHAAMMLGSLLPLPWLRTALTLAAPAAATIGSLVYSRYIYIKLSRPTPSSTDRKEPI